jgi:hypothetical protein
MGKVKTIISKRKLSMILALISGGIFMLLVSYFLITSSLKGEYFEIIGLIIGLLFGLFGVISICSILFIKTYVLDHEKLVIKSFLNYPLKIIYIKEIISYNEIEKENKYKKWKDLNIFTGNQKAKISSSVISNYSLFKERLSTNTPRNEYAEKVWAYRVNRRYGWGFFVAGLLFISLFLKIFTTPYKEILPDQITSIKGTVSEKLKIDYGHKSSRSIRIKLDEYSSFTFLISGHSFYASDKKGILANISSGDIIQLDILSEAYSKKLTKTEELTFWDKGINYKIISVKGLRTDNRKYLTLNSINIRSKSDSKSIGTWLILVIGLAGITSGTNYFTKKKPAANMQL